jgi:hypothetical protein
LLMGIPSDCVAQNGPVRRTARFFRLHSERFRRSG